MSTVSQKNRELEKYAVLLESIEPPPGVQPEKLLKLIESGHDSNDATVDFRDVKIVSLAKKCRNLNMTLMKEKTLADKKASECMDLSRQVEALKKEVDLVSPAQRATTLKQARALSAPMKDTPETTAELADVKKSLKLANNQIEEMRRKVLQSQDEQKKMKAALVKELGEGTNIEQALSGEGWRGRSQQIIMLKSKIKRLENTLHETQNSMTLGTINEESTFGPGTPLINGNMTVSTMGTNYTSKTTTRADINGRPFDVDSKADADLRSMNESRQQAIEMITEERARLAERVNVLEKQKLASKARIKGLEGENQRQRDQLKTLIEKVDGDDQLVTALKQEIERLKIASRRAIQDAKSMQIEQQTKVRGADGKSSLMNKYNPENTEAAEAEAKRVNRLVQTQKEQLNTQEDVIKSLRQQLKICSCGAKKTSVSATTLR